MIVANLNGSPVEAERTLEKAPYACPWCGHPVTLKPGRVVIAHFAHAPGADCAAAQHEGKDHLAAKKVLARQFRSLGYGVRLEYPIQRVRRVDVAVALPTGHHVAVELQDSPIAVDEMKARMAIDRRYGFLATFWVWIGKRYQLLNQAACNREGRIPEEMRWLQNRLHVGLYGLPIDHADLETGGEYPVPPTRFAVGGTHREGNSWYGEGGEEMYSSGYTPKTIKSVGSQTVSFALEAREARYHRPGNPDWTVTFREAA